MQLVIFDCDGVLVESEAILISAEIEFLARHGVIFDRAAYMRTYLGMAPLEWKEKLSIQVSEQLGRAVAHDFFEELDEFTTRLMREQLVSVDGARAAIEQLPLKRCVASSSSSKGLEWKLKHTQLADLFDNNLFSTELVEHGKPEPDLFLHAAQVMGYAPAQCFVVEDSANGVIAAKKAGMLAIGFEAGSHCLKGHRELLLSEGADVVAGSYSELTEIIASLMSEGVG